MYLSSFPFKYQDLDDGLGCPQSPADGILSVVAIWSVKAKVVHTRNNKYNENYIYKSINTKPPGQSARLEVTTD